jgi:hypothetical protein
VRSDAAPIFVEVQRFTQAWLWSVVVLVTVAAWVGAVAAVAGSDANAAVAVLLALVGTALPLLFALARLCVEVHLDRVEIRYRPFVHRTIARTDVASAAAVTYRPVRDYGGWGIKGWSRRKVAYNVRGRRWALLTLADGRTVLLGSQRPEELASAVRGDLPGR